MCQELTSFSYSVKICSWCWDVVNSTGSRNRGCASKSQAHYTPRPHSQISKASGSAAPLPAPRNGGREKMPVFRLRKKAVPTLPPKSPFPQQAAQIIHQGSTALQAISKHLVSQGEKSPVSEPGGPSPTSLLPLCAGEACLWFPQRDNVIKKFQIPLSNHNLPFHNIQLLLRARNNVLKKVFQIILTTTTEIMALESVFLLNSVVSHIMNSSS